MSITFNPFTGRLDFTGSGSTTSTLTKKEVIKAILLESNQSLDLPLASILFDEDSILFNDDDGALA